MFRRLRLTYSDPARAPAASTTTWMTLVSAGSATLCLSFLGHVGQIRSVHRLNQSPDQIELVRGQPQSSCVSVNGCPRYWPRTRGTEFTTGAQCVEDIENPLKPGYIGLVAPIESRDRFTLRRKTLKLAYVRAPFELPRQPFPSVSSASAIASSSTGEKFPPSDAKSNMVSARSGSRVSTVFALSFE